jgi:hypothetical protein
LAQLGPELAQRGIRVRAIFTSIADDGRIGDWRGAQTALPFAREVRWASHPRITEAHEQLVVAGAACWIGDCMRRDPTKRDAFEQYRADDEAASRVAARSFEHLWRIAQPLSGAARS